MRNTREIDRALYLFDSGRAVGAAEGHVAGYREGYAAGRADEREHLLTELDDAQRSHFTELHTAVLGTVLARGNYANLCDLRGEPDRAARQRATLTERGIA